MGRGRYHAQIGAHRPGGDVVRAHHRRESHRHGDRATLDEEESGYMSSTGVVGALPLDLRAKRSWRAAKSAIMTFLMIAAVVAVCIPLIAVVWSVVVRGISVAFAGFPDFFIKEIPSVSRR